MTTNCIGLEDALDAVLEQVQSGISPDAIAHCVACGSGRVEADDDGVSAYCLDCHATESTVDWIVGAELPRELAAIWANAPVIDEPALITTAIYKFEEAA